MSKQFPWGLGKAMATVIAKRERARGKPRAWLPIATAPKDGTVYLATDWKQFHSENCPPNCMPGNWECRGNDWYGVFNRDNFKPTHWAHLPVRPKYLKES